MSSFADLWRKEDLLQNSVGGAGSMMKVVEQLPSKYNPVINPNSNPVLKNRKRPLGRNSKGGSIPDNVKDLFQRRNKSLKVKIKTMKLLKDNIMTLRGKKEFFNI
jgi:hypothetical protein